SVVASTGQASVDIPLRSHTFVTGDPNTPCPVCTGSPATCSYGINAGKACTPVGTQGTTIDCPPSPDLGAYLPEFAVNLAPLTTGASAKSAADGLFCPSQATISAFGTQAPRGADPKLIVSIKENGSVAGDLSGGAVGNTSLAAVFCIPATGNGLIDGAAD